MFVIYDIYDTFIWLNCQLLVCEWVRNKRKSVSHIQVQEKPNLFNMVKRTENNEIMTQTLVHQFSLLNSRLLRLVQYNLIRGQMELSLLYYVSHLIYNHRWLTEKVLDRLNELEKRLNKIGSAKPWVSYTDTGSSPFTDHRAHQNRKENLENQSYLMTNFSQ